MKGEVDGRGSMELDVIGEYERRKRLEPHEVIIVTN